MSVTQNVLSQVPAGAPICMEVEGLKARLNAILLGLRPTRFVITTIPTPCGGKTPQEIFSLLYRDNMVTCYLLVEGVAMAFKSVVIKYVIAPFPLLFLTFPLEVETVHVRQHERVRCAFQASLNVDGTALDGMITDLSQGGCSFVFPASVAPPTALDNAPALLASAQLGMLGDGGLRIQVRSRHIKPDKIRLGLKFTALPEAMHKPLRKYLLDARWLATE